MALVTEPIALDRSLNTTEQASRNIADVLAQALQMLNTTISGLNFINCVVVQTLPTTDISTTTIYLVPKNPSQTDNLYDEYINLTGTSAGWEKIGDTEIDLSGYYTSAEVDALLADKADVSDIPTVNDGTLTIQQNGETKGTFTANQSGNSTVNIEIPTTNIQTAVDEFETYNGGILDSLKVALSPIQDLSHGDPSPTNICPISGHTQVDVDVSDGDTTQEQVTVNLGGTYYSGTLDVVSGKLTDDGKKVVCVLDGTEGFTKSSTYQGSFYRNWNYFNPAGKVNGQIKCSHAKFVTLESGEYVYGKCTSDNSVNLWLGQPEWTITDFHNYLATQYANGTPVTIEYEVNSPTETETQLSPTMVKALVGENHLSAPLDGQEITESKYRELFTWDEVESYVNAHSGGGSGMNYSTNEQVIGTWIDSKPLYQKTIDFGALPNANTKDLSHGIANIDKVWISGGFAYQPNGDFANQLSLCVPSSLSAGWYFGVNSTIVRCETSSDRTNYSAYVTIQYTKTTD